MTNAIVRRPVRVALAGVVCVLAMGTLVACSDDDKTDSAGTTTTQEVSVLDGTYSATSVSGYTLVEGSSITLEFSGVQLSFNAGCNNMSGNYTIEDDVLKLTGEVAGTMMACADGLEAQDQWLSGLLTSGMDITKDDGPNLVLTSGDVVITLMQGSTAAGEELNGQEPGGTPMGGE